MTLQQIDQIHDHDATLPRIGKWGDGWRPNAYGPDDRALAVFNSLPGMTRAEGLAAGC